MFFTYSHILLPCIERLYILLCTLSQKIQRVEVLEAHNAKAGASCPHCANETDPTSCWRCWIVMMIDNYVGFSIYVQPVSWSLICCRTILTINRCNNNFSTHGLILVVYQTWTIHFHEVLSHLPWLEATLNLSVNLPKLNRSVMYCLWWLTSHTWLHLVTGKHMSTFQNACGWTLLRIRAIYIEYQCTTVVILPWPLHHVRSLHA